MKKLFRSFFRDKSKIQDKNYSDLIIPKIEKFSEILKTKNSISFLHYGHLGDLIHSLPLLKEISKNKTCNLYIEKNKPLPKHAVMKGHPAGSVFLNENTILKLMPLLKEQKFLNKIEIYRDQEIDVDLNYFREMPINFNTDSRRWYFHLVGVFPNLSQSYLDVKPHSNFKNFIIIMRSLRRQNKHIDYSFLSSFDNIVFLGLKDEFSELKKKITNLEHYDSKDFLELAMIIKNAKLFIGNNSFGYALAEALKVPRLLESGPDFPLVYPFGENAYDFYFQKHFENLVKKICR
tara:strand:+ start:100 stop:972 length:873 start_codon:yes stop_codon:yes gene_type:complete